MNDFEQDTRRKQEIRGRPWADAKYRIALGQEIKIKRKERKDHDILDKEYAIDVDIILPTTGLILNGQEKFLSHKYSYKNSLTVEYYQNHFTQEPGDWFKLGVQFYFTGYLNKYSTDLEKWIIVNWPNMVLATEAGEITWQYQYNKDGHAKAGFRYVDFDQIPYGCVILRGLNGELKTRNIYLWSRLHA